MQVITMTYEEFAEVNFLTRCCCSNEKFVAKYFKGKGKIELLKIEMDSNSPFYQLISFNE